MPWKSDDLFWHNYPVLTGTASPFYTAWDFKKNSKSEHSTLFQFTKSDEEPLQARNNLKWKGLRGLIILEFFSLKFLQVTINATDSI